MIDVKTVTLKEIDQQILWKLRDFMSALRSADYWNHFCTIDRENRGRYTKHWVNAVTAAKYARIELVRLKGIRKRLFFPRVDA